MLLLVTCLVLGVAQLNAFSSALSIMLFVMVLSIINDETYF
ncbi:conserved hypothetical protein [Vibrio crassostreae]|nr:conserved hypothetical protein [Vibrio crassostreae]CAK3352331.1 conserved hypothetical protein [Vibrio crassostreae]